MSKAMYHPDGRVKLAGNDAEAKELSADGFHDSPAAFGVETAPGAKPDAAIAAKKPGAAPAPALLAPKAKAAAEPAPKKPAAEPARKKR